MKKTLKQRKAQMEIMGLAIIIILVILGLLFGMMFLRDEPEDIKQSFEQKTLATGFLNTILGTTSTCHQATFRELIQDCAQGEQVRCPNTGLASCDQVSLDFNNLFEDILKERKQGFKLTVKGPGNVASISQGRECPGEVVAGFQNVPTRLGTAIELILQICKEEPKASVDEPTE